MTEQLGKLERRDPREVWKTEPYEFTPWLRQNIDLLGEALGLEIDVDVQQEIAVGLFSADLLGTDVATNAAILIENQLELTDHTHLGQLLTYAGGLDTGILVWVSTKVREEHRQALTWLNEKTRDDVLIFAVEIELFSIDGGTPAPHFNVVVSPNEWQKQRAGRGIVGSGSERVSSERQERYRMFWRSLLEELLARDPTATTASPDRVPGQNWYGISIGRSGFQDNFVFGWNYEEHSSEIRVELYIDVGDKAQNKAIFDLLLETRGQIDTAFKETLLWTRRDDIRASRIYVRRPGAIDDPTEQLDAHRQWGVEQMLRMREVFGPRVKALALPLPVVEVDLAEEVGDRSEFAGKASDELPGA